MKTIKWISPYLVFHRWKGGELKASQLFGSNKRFLAESGLRAHLLYLMFAPKKRISNQILLVITERCYIEQQLNYRAVSTTEHSLVKMTDHLFQQHHYELKVIRVPTRVKICHPGQLLALKNQETLRVPEWELSDQRYITVIQPGLYLK